MTGKPRIGFDALFLEQPMTGAGQYALNLWRQLRDHQCEYEPCLLMPSDAPDAVASEHRQERVTATPRIRPLNGHARKMWWEQAGVVAATRTARAVIAHIPYFAAPLRQRVPHVVTIHDVIPLAVPAYRGSIKMRAYLSVVARAARKAELILTDSEYSRGDIERYLGISSSRVRVTPLAAGKEFTPARLEEDYRRIEQTRAKYGLSERFVLYIGGFDVRKRVPELICGFAAALPSLSEPYDLVIPGRAHTGNPEVYPPVEPLIRQLGIDDHVRLIGFVSHEEKIDLYRSASVFVFPSMYEGFGLDPLEAMACGAPVICSNRSSLPEVVGDAGLLIEPAGEEIARALIAVLRDDELRADLIGRSVRRAAKFSWDHTMHLTLRAYDEVLERVPIVPAITGPR